MAKTDKPAADKMLNDFNLRIMADAEKLTEDLTNQLFTIRTKDIQSDIFFANAAKRLSHRTIIIWRKADTTALRQHQSGSGEFIQHRGSEMGVCPTGSFGFDYSRRSFEDIIDMRSHCVFTDKKA